MKFSKRMLANFWIRNLPDQISYFTSIWPLTQWNIFKIITNFIRYITSFPFAPLKKRIREALPSHHDKNQVVKTLLDLGRVAFGKLEYGSNYRLICYTQFFSHKVCWDQWFFFGVNFGIFLTWKIWNPIFQVKRMQKYLRFFFKFWRKL